MPRHKNDLVSKSMVRDANECRLVITLELKISDAQLKQMPSYISRAEDYMRKVLKEEEFDLNWMDWVADLPGVEILEHKMEVAK